MRGHAVHGPEDHARNRLHTPQVQNDLHARTVAGPPHQCVGAGPVAATRLTVGEDTQVVI